MSKRAASVFGVIFVLGLSLGPALASSSGINSFSGNPATQSGMICNICHGGGITPIVALSGPESVEPGSTNRYTLTIRGGQEIAGGLDVSVTDGALASIDLGTKILFEELTHSSPRDADAFGDVRFDFDWTAPISEGNVTMYGAGNSVNLTQGTNGDAASNDLLDIAVGGMSSTPGETSGSGLQQLLVTAHDFSTSTLDVSYDTGCDTTDNSVYFGDLADVSTYSYAGEVCNIGSGASASFELPAGSYFFVIVGDNGAKEGSYGTNGALDERPSSGTCGLAQDLTNTCIQP